MLHLFKRIFKAYQTIGLTFGRWITPLFVGLYLLTIRTINFIFMKVDWIFYPTRLTKEVTRPILIVGNPRSGTSFIHRYLVNNGFGTGSRLYQMVFTSIVLQKIIKPILPILEKVSPAKFHSDEVHKTSLNAIETDDPSLLFRFFDGFFLYAFILSWAKVDLLDWFQPKIRDNSKRDFNWLDTMWRRTLISSRSDRMIGKLFSISVNIPAFLNRFPDAKLLYMIRDPLNVIPSGLSLVTGVLDGVFGFWNLPKDKRQFYIDRLYTALVELQLRFYDDWINGRIDKNKVMIVKYDMMMSNFEDLMDEILTFVDHDASKDLLEDIKQTAEKQRDYKSKHKYDLEKFGLSEEKIRKDCKKIYDTFLNE
tara:strand:+ start:2071 stop:3165 length:1095 start_codon:yes stop_codon:yes gene_type:complete